MTFTASNIPEDYINPSKIMAFWYGGRDGPHFMDVLKGSGEIKGIEEIGRGSGGILQRILQTFHRKLYRNFTENEVLVKPKPAP